MHSRLWWSWIAVAIATSSCSDGDTSSSFVEDELSRAPSVVADTESPAPSPIGVSSADRTPITLTAHTAPLSVEARVLVVAADGGESEALAIRSALDYRGVPYDVFVSSTAPPLTAATLGDPDHGRYQAIIITSYAVSLAADEWAALADYEATFGVRRAVLAASPDPALGFGPSTVQHTSTTPLDVTCTTAGAAVFADVNCAATQTLRSGDVYLTTPVSGAPLTPLLVDAAGHAIAAIHHGADGRDTLLLLDRNSTSKVHTLVFMEGVIGWVTGGVYLGARRLDLSAQVDDVFITGNVYDGSTFRLGEDDLDAARTWLLGRRAQASTPDFRIALAFNGAGAHAGDALTEEAEVQAADWHWISHTYDHSSLDEMSYAAAFEELDHNRIVAANLGLDGFDVRNLVTPNVTGLVNADVMDAALDVGVRFAVTDTSRPGCANPSPNTTFYDAVAPTMLLVPRRPTNLYVRSSTPAEWVAQYNVLEHDTWGRDSTYAQVLDQESDVLLLYLLRGEEDPWMFHQTNLRAYDGVHSVLGDLLDATLAKLAARLRVPVQTPPMETIGLRFAQRLAVDAAGVRATVFPGRALVIDAGAAVTVPVTHANGEITEVAVVPGTSACVALDAAGEGCSPAPVRSGGGGTPHALPVGICDASSIPHPDAGPPPIDAAPPPPIDAAVPDAELIPDAAPPPIDAEIIVPDAAPPPPIDAAPPPIDAAVRDAAVPDDAPAALPDALDPGPDATSADLPSSGCAVGGGGGDLAPLLVALGLLSASRRTRRRRGARWDRSGTR